MNYRNFRTRKLKVKRGQEKTVLFYEIINKPSETLSAECLEQVTLEARKLTEINWGDFGNEFIKNHVFHAESVLLLRDKNNRLIGLASISTKNICSKKIYYFELTVVDKEYESLKLSFRMNYLLAKKIIISNFLSCRFSLDFMLITPNMKMLGSLANIAGFIYPNPYEFNVENNRIPSADTETWEMAQELIKNSDKPKRIIRREGLVLEGSNTDTPWLIYEPGEAPKYRDDVVNIFGEYYLGYSRKEDKEFIVRVNFTLINIIRSLLR